STNERLFYSLEDGPSRAIAFPRAGPFDERRGYSKLPAFQARLTAQNYRVTRQARQSETMLMLEEHGVSPPYPERPDAGLEILGADGAPLFRYGQSEFLFGKIDDIPPLLVKTLLFLENRDLDHPATPWQNPVIEWDRTLKAVLFYIGAKLHLPVPVQGGSTLAVQLEKFRHSPNGRTDTPLEKLRQIVGASLKAYREGANTRAWRERIVVDYINTVPLAAAPGYGEIHGLGEALYAWFGMRLSDAAAALNQPGRTPAKVRAFKHILTLLISVRAPSVFLVDERDSLEEKVDQFTRLLARAGVIDWEFAAEVQETPIRFLPAAPLPPQPSSSRNKAANAIRTSMMDALGVGNLYDLNRLHLQVQSTFNVSLQKQVTEFLHRLADPEFVSAQGLRGERLLENDDPSKVIYSFLLVEAAPQGNFIRVQADNLAAPFDFNQSVKLELGSTAKLRTITHYLEVMKELYDGLSGADARQLAQAEKARDPLTRWAAETLREQKGIALAAFLDLAMERRYSASPYEEFFTGGGLHHFDNFEKEDNDRILSLRDAFRNSVNLVFIRLMRDLVAYHRARLAFDAEDVLANPANPQRQKILQEIAEDESRQALRRAETRGDRAPAARLQRQSRAPPGGVVFRLAHRQERGRAAILDREKRRRQRQSRHPQALSRLQQSAPDAGGLRLSARHPPARSLVRRRISRHARLVVGKTLRRQRRGPARKLGVAPQQPQPARPGFAPAHPAGERSLQPHDALLAAARLSVQNHGAELRNGNRQLLGPAGRAGRAGRHSRQRRGAPSVGQLDHGALCRRHALRNPARPRAGKKRAGARAGNCPGRAPLDGRRGRAGHRPAAERSFPTRRRQGSQSRRQDRLGRQSLRHLQPFRRGAELARHQPHGHFRVLPRRALLRRDHRLRPGPRSRELPLHQRPAGDFVEAARADPLNQVGRARHAAKRKYRGARRNSQPRRR